MIIPPATKQYVWVFYNIRLFEHEVQLSVVLYFFTIAIVKKKKADALKPNNIDSYNNNKMIFKLPNLEIHTVYMLLPRLINNN